VNYTDKPMWDKLKGDDDSSSSSSSGDSAAGSPRKANTGADDDEEFEVDEDEELEEEEDSEEEEESEDEWVPEGGVGGGGRRAKKLDKAQAQQSKGEQQQEQQQQQQQQQLPTPMQGVLGSNPAGASSGTQGGQPQPAGTSTGHSMKGDDERIANLRRQWELFHQQQQQQQQAAHAQKQINKGMMQRQQALAQQQWQQQQQQQQQQRQQQLQQQDAQVRAAQEQQLKEQYYFMLQQVQQQRQQQQPGQRARQSPPLAQGTEADLPPLQSVDAHQQLLVLGLGAPQRLALLDALKAWGLQLDLIPAAAPGASSSSSQGQEAPQASSELWRRCHQAVPGASLRQVVAYVQLLVRLCLEAGVSPGPLFANQLPRCWWPPGAPNPHQAALLGDQDSPEDFLARLSSIQLIRQTVCRVARGKPLPEVASTFSVVCPAAIADALVETSNWRRSHDFLLLCGVLRHGFGRWRQLLDDPALITLKEAVRAEYGEPLDLEQRHTTVDVELTRLTADVNARKTRLEHLLAQYNKTNDMYEGAEKMGSTAALPALDRQLAHLDGLITSTDAALQAAVKELTDRADAVKAVQTQLSSAMETEEEFIHARLLALLQALQKEIEDQLGGGPDHLVQQQHAQLRRLLELPLPPARAPTPLPSQPPPGVAAVAPSRGTAAGGSQGGGAHPIPA
ncbi:hypothetical protein QJQ45_019875, partial [Haematococcus lacustris]